MNASTTGMASTMQVRKIALLGHSGAGKSACLKLMGLSRSCEMDTKFGVAVPPDAQTALDWIAHHPRQLVSVSVHKHTLEQIRVLKDRDDPAFPKNVYFLYLYRAKTGLEECLNRKRAEGCERPSGGSRRCSSSGSDR